MSEHLQFFDDICEIYVLDNLAWRMPTTDGYHVIQSQKFLKSVDPDGAILPAPNSVPVVREICSKCGGYGGEQLEDGWFSCYRCCEVGYEYTPLDLYLMEQVHLDALEDNYQRDMRIETSKADALKRLEGGFLGGVDKVIAVIDRILSPPPEPEDDIPF